MEEIATLAGVSKQTVYTHFPDKEALFTHLILRAFPVQEMRSAPLGSVT